MTERQLRQPKKKFEGNLPNQCRRHAVRLAVMAVAVVLSLGAAGSAQDVTDVPAIAFFGFQLINTSLEHATVAEDQRIRMLDDLFREKLSASGRFTIVAIPMSGPALQSASATAANAITPRE
jgi:hypothetical protein